MILATSLLAATLAGPVPMMASWYGGKHHEGRITASGWPFSSAGYSCAHRTLPFGTRLRIRVGNQRTIVTVDDRGPFVRGRDLDLSEAAATALGIHEAGVTKVWVEKVEWVIE